MSASPQCPSVTGDEARQRAQAAGIGRCIAPSATAGPFLKACEADKRGRKAAGDEAYPQADFLRQARDAAAAVPAQPFIAAGKQGPAIGEAMRQARIEAIAAIERPGKS